MCSNHYHLEENCIEFSQLILSTREQEKAETKDQKVLVILKEKDNNIKILQEVCFSQ